MKLRQLEALKGYKTAGEKSKGGDYTEGKVWLKREFEKCWFGL